MKRVSKFLILVLLLLYALVPKSVVEAAGLPNGVERIAGKNRVETSINISKSAYPNKSETIFIAGYSGEADALTATLIAAKKNAPLLLTYKDKLDSKLLDEIHRLDAKEIIILGGENAVNQSIEDTLKSKGYETRRIKGNSRIETAVNIALDYYKDKIVSEVFVVEYNSLVDALAIGPVSAKTDTPIFITMKDSVPDELVKFLKDHNVNKATIVGGENTVSDKGRDDLLTCVNEVQRIYGSDRAQTSLNIAQKYFKDSKNILVANGYNYSDAMIGGYFANIKNAPILLTNKDKINGEVLKYILETNSKPIVLGGEGVISSSIYKMVGNIPLPEIEEPKPIKPESQKPQTDTGLSIEEEVVRLVNIERKNNGLSAFRLDKKLSDVARIKSKDMADKKYFSHISPTYGSPFDMMKKFGVKYMAAGENIAMGYPTPEAVVKGWMNSKGHRENILNSKFNTIGVGAYTSSSNSIYWTQMFTN